MRVHYKGDKKQSSVKRRRKRKSKPNKKVNQTVNIDLTLPDNLLLPELDNKIDLLLFK